MNKYVREGQDMQSRFRQNLIQKIIPYEKILDIFWSTHDPTTLNRQGNDIGTQYRSAIFYHDQKQKEIAEKSKSDLEKAGVYKILL